VVFENPEKHLSRPSGPEPWLPFWPFRLLCSGPPGCGKRNLLLNLIMRLDPPPTSVHLVHCDPDTVEYDLLAALGAPMYVYEPEDFPTVANIEAPDPIAIGAGPDVGDASEADDAPLDGSEDAEDSAAWAARVAAAPLVIVDEVTKDALGPVGAARFERLMNHVSTHRNCSVICSIQQPTLLPPKCRRGFNHFALWPQADTGATTMAALRSGVPAALLHELFADLCRDRHDSIWVDTTRPPDSEYRFRLNMATPIRAAETVRV
jgi:hypothetical protein